MDTSKSRRFSRRQVLQGMAVALGGISGSAILAACGGPSPAPPPAAGAPTAKPAAPAAATTAPAAGAPTAAPAAAAKPPASGDRVTIRDHDWIQGNPGQQGDWYDGFIAKFEADNPTIKVEREWFPREEMHAKQLALAATGQIGDTVRINVAPVVSELQLKGVVRELDSLFASDAQWTANDQKQFWPGNLKTYTRGGKLYGLPVVGHPGAVQWYINRTMVESLGLKMPGGDGNWSFDDALTLAKGLTKAEGGRTTVYGIMPPVGATSTNEGMVGFLRAFGGDLFDADGKKTLLNTPESIAGLKALDAFYKAGAALPWAPDIEANRQENFLSQRIAIVVQTSFAASSWPGLIAQRPQPFEMEVIPNPIGSTGKHASQVSSDGKGLSAAGKNPDKAWTVLSRLYTGQRHGIERFTNGLGSPGSRNDVWDSQEFREKAPKLGNIAKVLVLPPAPEMAAWHHPANGRYQETEPILINEFVKVTLGQLTVEQYAEQVHNQIQAILDKPSV